MEEVEAEPLLRYLIIQILSIHESVKLISWGLLLLLSLPYSWHMLYCVFKTASTRFINLQRNWTFRA
jgi:hypothetical protein